MYRPPGTDNDLTGLASALGSIQMSRYSKVVILGDFNVNVNVNSSQLSTVVNFLSLTSGFGLQQLVDTPTRVTQSNGSTIDLVLSNCPHMVTSLAIDDPLGSSDHHSIKRYTFQWVDCNIIFLGGKCGFTI